MRAAIITLSDSGFAGRREDRSGPVIRAMLEQAGFTEIKTYGDQSFALVQGGEDRIYFTARKRD